LVLSSKVPPDAIIEGFVGYAALSTDERIYSAPAAFDQGLEEFQSMTRGAVA